MESTVIEVRIDPKHTSNDNQFIPTYYLSDDVVDYLNLYFGKGYWNYKVMNDRSDTYHWLVIENDCKLFIDGSLHFNDRYGFDMPPPIVREN